MAVDVIPSGVNLAKNPSFSLNADGWYVAPVGGTVGSMGNVVRATAWAWSGKYSGFSTLSGTSNRTGFYFYTAPTQGTYALPVTAGDPYSLSLRVKASLSGKTGGVGYVIVTFKNAANEAVGVTIPDRAVSFSNGVPFTLTLENFVAPVGAVFCVPAFHITSNDGSVIGTGSNAHIDGFQFNPGEQVEFYIDGEQGPSYGWDGTPGASTSYRLDMPIAGPTGRGGVIELDGRVYLATRHNELLEDVTDYVLAGQVTGDIDRDGPKWTLSVEVSDPEKIPRFAWLSIFQDVDREGEDPFTRQLGLYRLQQPKETLDGESNSVTYAGYDPTILLADASSDDTTYFAPGTLYIDAIRSLCNDVGVSHDFVNSTKVIPDTGFSRGPGTSYLKIVNELLADIGYYSVSANHIGILYSFPIIENLNAVEPIRFYSVGDDSELLDDLVFDPNDDSIFNHVVVYRDDPAKGLSLIAVREFRDAESPIAVQNLGKKSKVISLQDAADQAAVDAKAAEEIQKRTMYVSGVLSVLPDPVLWLHNVINLDLRGMEHVPGSQKHNGRYYINSLTFPVGTADGVVKLGIRRVERTDI